MLFLIVQFNVLKVYKNNNDNIQTKTTYFPQHMSKYSIFFSVSKCIKHLFSHTACFIESTVFALDFLSHKTVILLHPKESRLKCFYLTFKNMLLVHLSFIFVVLSLLRDVIFLMFTQLQANCIYSLTEMFNFFTIILTYFLRAPQVQIKEIDPRCLYPELFWNLQVSGSLYDDLTFIKRRAAVY